MQGAASLRQREPDHLRFFVPLSWAAHPGNNGNVSFPLPLYTQMLPPDEGVK
jgi:hypothetical protein